MLVKNKRFSTSIIVSLLLISLNTLFILKPVTVKANPLAIPVIELIYGLFLGTLATFGVISANDQTGGYLVDNFVETLNAPDEMIEYYQTAAGTKIATWSVKGLYEFNKFVDLYKYQSDTQGLSVTPNLNPGDYVDFLSPAFPMSDSWTSGGSNLINLFPGTYDISFLNPDGGVIESNSRTYDIDSSKTPLSIRTQGFNNGKSTIGVFYFSPSWNAWQVLFATTVYSAPLNSTVRVKYLGTGQSVCVAPPTDLLKGSQPITESNRVGVTQQGVSVPSTGSTVWDRYRGVPLTGTGSQTGTLVGNGDIVTDLTGVIPIPTTGTGEGEGEGSTSIPTDWSVPNSVSLDFSPLSLPFTEKFPFCLPFDLYNSVQALNVTPVTPRWDITFSETYFTGGGSMVIDFAEFDTLARVIRWFLTLVFVIGLIILTRRML